MVIAKEYAYEFTADMFTELSEEELEGVAGGWTVHDRGRTICCGQ
ncbi:hypothetical protein SynBIOSE41_01878 [Synechococcus sp. BIOS-E4-1]|nr:hypothetical protein SynBIOSE41_01878 [Synechococcus sp. BIOS-E4-1]